MYFSEWLIVFSYAKSIYETRGKRAWIISFLLYGGLMIVYGYVINQEIVNILLTVLCNLLLLFLCFKSTFKSSFFHAIALGITQLISEVIAVYAIAFFVHLPTDVYRKRNHLCNRRDFQQNILLRHQPFLGESFLQRKRCQIVGQMGTFVYFAARQCFCNCNHSNCYKRSSSVSRGKHTVPYGFRFAVVCEYCHLFNL